MVPIKYNYYKSISTRTYTIRVKSFKVCQSETLQGIIIKLTYRYDSSSEIKYKIYIYNKKPQYYHVENIKLVN